MKVITISAVRSERLYFKARRFLARLPLMTFCGFIAYVTVKDPYWAWKAVTHPWVHRFMQFISDPFYRSFWTDQYLGIVVVLVIALLVAFYALKTGIWNRVFKTLVISTDDNQHKHVRPIGRCYWIERHNCYRFARVIMSNMKAFLKAFRIIDIRVEDVRLRRLKGDVDVPKLRMIFYKPRMFPLSMLAPWRAMHRIKAYIPDENITVHDPETLLVKGFRMERDMRESYPTFTLTNNSEVQALIDIDKYRTDFDDVVERASLSVNNASQMDSFILKEQRKFQEVAVPIDRELVEMFRNESKQNR